MKNNKKIKLGILIALLIVCLFIVTLISIKGGTNNGLNICGEVKQASSNKETFALFITDGLRQESDSNDIVEKYFKNYKNSNNSIYSTSFQNINSKCFKGFLTTNNYNDIMKNKFNTVLAYKKGKLVSSIINITDYYYLENFLDKNDIIKKNVIKEDIGLNDFNKKIKNDKYILAIIAEEETRGDIKEKIEKVFSDYDTDIVNMRDGEGKKIFDKVSKMVKLDQTYPKIIYFSNGKYVTSIITATESTMKEFKSQIEK